MLSEDEIKKQLLDFTAEIKKSFIQHTTEMRGKDKIVNEQEARNLYYELETEVKKCLVQIFGEANKTESNALSSAFMGYNSLDNSRSDAVIFNYWSYKGEPIETPMKSETGRWRDNLYYKGKRWSDKEEKRLFYKFFDVIKSALQGEAPVDFFTKHGFKCNTRHLKIIGGSIANSTEISKSSTHRRIVIPILKPGSESYTGIKSNLFRQLLDLISEMKKFNKEAAQLEHFQSSNQEKIKKIEDLVVNAYFDAENADRGLLVAVRDGFIEGLTDSNEKKDELRTVISLRDVFNVVIAYQYYDTPYDIHMFMPASNDKELFSCLVITVERNNGKIEPYVDSFIALANELGQITALEREIWRLMGDNLPIYWKWKEHYEKFSDRYERLSNVAMGICHAICSEEKIEVFSIPSRLKEFDSFYNKIVNRANGRDLDYPKKTGDISEGRWLTIRAERLNEYRAKILNPTDKNAEKIFRDLKDVVGLRIICLYYTEINKIVSTFQKLSINEEIENYDAKEFDDPQGYRSYHISFSLGSKRCEFYELKDLRDWRCEIQIRTVLEQGWADVDHTLVYKSGVPHLLVENIMADIKSELGSYADLLRLVDKGFERIFTKWKQITRP